MSVKEESRQNRTEAVRQDDLVSNMSFLTTNYAPRKTVQTISQYHRLDD